MFPSLFMLQLEEQVSRLQREKNDLQSRMEEDQEDMNELMKKHKAAVAQVTQPAENLSEQFESLENTPTVCRKPWSVSKGTIVVK